MKNFEKHIKNKASAFQMDPMPDTFDKVMDALEKKKKRRFIFWLWFIIPVFAIGGTVGTYQIFMSSQKPALAKNNKKDVQITNGPSSSNSNISSTSSENINTKTDNNNSSKTNIGSTSSEKSVNTNSVANKNESYRFTETKNQSTQYANVKKNDIVVNDQKANTINSTTNNTKNEEKTISTVDVKQRVNESTIRMFTSSLVYIPQSKNRSVFSTKDVPLVPAALNSPNLFVIGKRNKFSLGVYSDLGVSKSSYIANNVDSNTIGYPDARRKTDKFIFSYSAGLSFRYSPVKFLAIETGIGFTRYESNQIVINVGFSSSSMTTDLLDTVETLSIGTAPASKEYRNIYDYISIPFKLYYQKRWNWAGIEAGGGVVFDIPINTESYVADENTGLSYLRNGVKDSRLNMFGIQASANVNMVFHIQRFSFYVGPTFKYRVNSMFDENYIIKQHNYFIGGQLGARYNF